jgi:hypothetical protein
MKSLGVVMRLQKKQFHLSYRFADPIVAKPEVIVAIRRLVQNSCMHDEFSPLDQDNLRVECVDCGHQTFGMDVEQLLSVAR